MMVNMVFLPVLFFYKYIYILSFVIKKRHIITSCSFISSSVYIISNFALIFYRQVFEACGCVRAEGAGGPRQQPGGVISTVWVVFQDSCFQALLSVTAPPPPKKSPEMWLLLS